MTKICLYCGDEYPVFTKQDFKTRKFCSMKCSDANKKGRVHHLTDYELLMFNKILDKLISQLHGK